MKRHRMDGASEPRMDAMDWITHQAPTHLMKGMPTREIVKQTIRYPPPDTDEDFQALEEKLEIYTDKAWLVLSQEALEKDDRPWCLMMIKYHPQEFMKVALSFGYTETLYKLILDCPGKAQ